MKLTKWLKLLDEKAKANKEIIKSRDFQEWLIHIKTQRVITTNYINK